MKSFFPITWSMTEDENEKVEIRSYGLDTTNKTVCLRITDFTPYFYVALPSDWMSHDHAQMVCSAIKRVLQYNLPVKIDFNLKHNLYYGDSDKKGSRKRFPYIRLTFRSEKSRQKAKYSIKRGLMIEGTEHKLMVFEDRASPIVQFISFQKLKTASWLEYTVDKVMDNRLTTCAKEFFVYWKDIKLLDDDTLSPPVPKMISFDIECNSDDPQRFTNALFPNDKIFQISCVIQSPDPQGGSMTNSLLFSLVGDESQIPEMKHSNFEIQAFTCEADMLCAFWEFIRTCDAYIFMGYNIFGFDLPYLIKRSEYLLCTEPLLDIGKNLDSLGEVKDIKWSSSAYKDQEFYFVNAEGVLFVDLLHIVKRDYKLSNYKLDTVANLFLGKEKDPLTHLDIFRCYRSGMTGTQKGTEDLLYVGKYCVVDSSLVLDIFKYCDTWSGLTAMASICNVSITDLIVRGQTYKVFCQVYAHCIHNDIVVQTDFLPETEGGYQGAFVFDPVPGLYENIVPLDFSSMYPTSIIAGNIDFTTFVPDWAEDVPDSWCNVIEWDEHVGCEHDLVPKKTKGKYILCGHKRYRFLKEPAGVIPTIVKNLLEARKITRARIKTLAKDDPLRSVLDKRQLSLKVSANSMYGALGASKGLIRLVEGAAATTAMGRQSIEKVAKVVTEEYHGQVVYGDSVSGDTPILVKFDCGTVSVRRIDDMPKHYWEWFAYKAFKPNDLDRTDKQQHFPSSGLETWTSSGWKKVVRVIRHKTKKKMYRVVTGLGCVDVTEDHSLLGPNKELIKPGEVNIDDELFHLPPSDALSTDPVPSVYKRCKNKQEAQRLYISLLAKHGYAQLSYHEDGYMFKTDGKPSGEDTRVKEIIPLPDSNDFVYDIETEDGTFMAGVGCMIVKNTDSAMIHFPHLKTSEEIWDHSVIVADEVSKLFPPPMKLEFEEKIYRQFLTLTKKRYMSSVCYRDGIVVEKNGQPVISDKGVLLSRRDNSGIVRSIYADVVKRIFQHVLIDDIHYLIISRLNDVASRNFPLEDYGISKSISGTNDFKTEKINDNAKKLQMGSYKVSSLPSDEDARALQLYRKKAKSDEDYYFRCLPHAVQLAEKMRQRGNQVMSGSRIDFIITRQGDADDLLGSKIEDLEYATKYSWVWAMRPDMMYYLKSFIKPLDELLSIVYGKKEKDSVKIPEAKTCGKFKVLRVSGNDKFVNKQFIIRRAKESVLKELEGLFTPKKIWK